MKLKRVLFENKKGEKLSARIEMPVDQAPVAYALFAHCFTCNKNLGAARNISRALTSNGIAVMRFDFTGLGESEGDFADTNFSSNIEDLVQAAQYLEEHFEAPSLLIGHSLGGAAVIFAAAQLPSIAAVATVGAPASPEHVTHLLENGIDEIESKGVVTMNIGGRPFTVKRHFIEDLRKQKLSEILSKLNKPLLVLHSPQDTTVGIENATELYKWAKHPKSFISLDGADHLLMRQGRFALCGRCNCQLGKAIY